jgi:hypothetical protein
MTKLCLWYHDPDSNDLMPGLSKKIKSFGFKIEKPKNRIEFLNMINQLDGQDLTLHIFAHGDKVQIAPFNLRDVKRKELEGDDINVDDCLIQYSRIKPILDSFIGKGCQLTVNLMSVCDSFYSSINAKYYLSCCGESQVTDESLDIYNHREDHYFKVIDALNSKKINPNGTFHLKTHG